MTRASTQEIIEAYRQRASVHVESRLSFHGMPGHYYVVPRAPTDTQMAQITQRCGNAEVTYMRINDAHLLYVGARGFATATFLIPSRGEGIEEFHWVVHTHPLDQANQDQAIAEGPTNRDFEALDQVNRSWGQSESRVIVCRRGRIIRVVSFRVERQTSLSDVRTPLSP